MRSFVRVTAKVWSRALCEMAQNSQRRRLGEVYRRDIYVVEESYRHLFSFIRTTDREVYHLNAHRIPSSSEDLTFARTTSDVNGLNTTIRNITDTPVRPAFQNSV
jgi:hypothetical protein